MTALRELAQRLVDALPKCEATEGCARLAMHHCAVVNSWIDACDECMPRLREDAGSMCRVIEADYGPALRALVAVLAEPAPEAGEQTAFATFTCVEVNFHDDDSEFCELLGDNIDAPADNVMVDVGSEALRFDKKTGVCVDDPELRLTMRVTGSAKP